MLSGQKDADFIILSKLNDRDLLSVCITDKYANRLCNNEDFWRNRFITKYGVDFMKYNTTKTWKRFYLLIVKYLNGSEYWNSGMYGASKGGHRDLVEFFIAKGATVWNFGMNGAAKGGHRDLVEFFIAKEANKWKIGRASCRERVLMPV